MIRRQYTVVTSKVHARRWYEGQEIYAAAPRDSRDDGLLFIGQ